MFVKESTDKTFGEDTKDGTIVIDFHAEFCSPCKALKPVLEDLAKQYDGKVKVLSVDVGDDECRKTAEKYKVSSIPLLVVLKDGVEVMKKVGFAGRDSVKEIFEKIV